MKADSLVSSSTTKILRLVPASVISNTRNGGGQTEIERRPLARFGLHPYAALVRLDDGLADCQPQT